MSYRVNGTDLDNLFEPREGRPLNIGWETDDETEWTGLASRKSIVTPGDAPDVPTCFQISSTSGVDFRSATRFSVNPNKRYRVSTWARQFGSNQNCYLLVGFYNSSGNLISNTTSPNNTGLGWDSSGTYNYWGVVNEPFPDDWTYYEYEFGNGQTAQIPPTAVTAVVGALTSRDSATINNTQFNNYRIEEIPVGFGNVFVDTTNISPSGSADEANPIVVTFSTTYVGKALLRIYAFEAESGVVADFNGARLSPVLSGSEQEEQWYEFEVNTVSGTNTIEIYRVNTDGYNVSRVQCIQTPDQPGGATPDPSTNYSRTGTNLSTRYETIEHDTRIPDIPYFENGVSLSRLLKGNVSQFVLDTNRARSTRTTAWNGTVNVTGRATFSSATALENFFTFGGRLIVSASRNRGSNTAKNNEWSTILANAGSIEITKTLVMQDRNTVLSSAGADVLTSSGQLIYSNSGTSTYSSAVMSVFAAKLTSTVIEITVQLSDGASGVIDENIDGFLDAYFDVRRHPSQPAPAFTITNEW